MHYCIIIDYCNNYFPCQILIIAIINNFFEHYCYCYCNKSVRYWHRSVWKVILHILIGCGWLESGQIGRSLTGSITFHRHHRAKLKYVLWMGGHGASSVRGRGISIFNTYSNSHDLTIKMKSLSVFPGLANRNTTYYQTLKPSMQ